MTPIKGRFYRHYKGGLYYVITFAEHTDTKEQLVIYCHVSGNVYARPLEDWLRPVEAQVSRFTLVPEDFKLYAPDL